MYQCIRFYDLYLFSTLFYSSTVALHHGLHIIITPSMVIVAIIIMHMYVFHIPIIGFIKPLALLTKPHKRFVCQISVNILQK